VRIYRDDHRLCASEHQEQDLTLQHTALEAAGCTRLYAEKMSGARADRPKLTRALQPGDLFIVTLLDRLARSSLDLLNNTT
jgi:DNA invertase Pin-like site-specific DNA recombinase